MDDELYLAALASDDLTILPVMVWLPTHEPAALRELDKSWLGAYTNAVGQHETAKQTARETFALDLAILGSVPAFYDPIVPAVWLQLTKSELSLLAHWKSVAAVYLDGEHIAGRSTSYPSTVEATGTGYSGDTIKSCVVESDRPVTPNNLGSYGLFCPGDNQDQHSRCVAAVMKSSAAPFGVSPDVRQRVNSWGGACGGNAGLAFENCRNQGANVWNWSHTCSTGDRRVLDYYVKVSPYPLISVLAGNSNVCGAGGDPWCPVYNAIVVGGVDDQGTSSRSDDTLYGGTCYGNPSGDWEFPHMCAPAVDIDADGVNCGTGTSFAAPHVAGAAAQLQERNSSLWMWPEAQRSILMTGAYTNIDGPVLDVSDCWPYSTSCVDDTDGAGLLSVQKSLTIGNPSYKVDGGNTPSAVGHDYGTLLDTSPSSGNFYSEVYQAKTTFSGLRLRVVLAWDGTVTCTDPTDPSTCAAPTLDADLDIYVYDSSNQLIASSLSIDNSFEFLEFDATQNETYSIKIYAYSWTNSFTYYGISWLFWTFGT